jgi:hypothetical protein
LKHKGLPWAWDKGHERGNGEELRLVWKVLKFHNGWDSIVEAMGRETQ